MSSRPARTLVHSPLSLPSVAAVVLLTGCGVDRGNADVALWTERDSAGVVIVDNLDDPVLSEAGFTLSEAPALSIGSLDGDVNYEFFRVSGGHLLEDGRVVVVNGVPPEVRIYQADGTFLHSFGTEGEGPGEFRSPRLLGVLPGDSLLVHDMELRRVSVVHPDDGFVSSVRVGDDSGGFPVPQGMLANGTMVFGGGLFFSSSDGGFPTGVIRNPSKYSAVDRSGAEVADFGEWPAFEMYGRVSAEGGFTARSLPFAKGSSAAVGQDRFYIGTSDLYEIHAFDEAANKVRVIRLDRPNPPVTSADVDQYTEDEIEDADTPNERRQFEALMNEMPIPDHMPAYGSMRVDALGHLWVQEYAGPRLRDPGWTIFDRDGHVLGTLRTPDRMQILEIGGDYILGRKSDALDVESIQLWELERPTG